MFKCIKFTRDKGLLTGMVLASLFFMFVFTDSVRASESVSADNFSSSSFESPMLMRQFLDESAQQWHWELFSENQIELIQSAYKVAMANQDGQAIVLSGALLTLDPRTQKTDVDKYLKAINSYAAQVNSWGNPQVVSYLLLANATRYLIEEKGKEGLVFTDKLIQHASQSNDQAMFMAANYMAGIFSIYQLDYRQSILYLRVASDIAEKAPYRLSGGIYNAMAGLYDNLKDHHQSLAYLQKAAATFAIKGSERNLGLIIANMGTTYQLIGKTVESKKAFFKSIELIKEFGSQNDLALVSSLYGCVLIDLDENQDGLDMLLPLVNGFSTLGLEAREQKNTLCIIKAYNNMSNFQQAKEMLNSQTLINHIENNQESKATYYQQMVESLVGLEMWKPAVKVYDKLFELEKHNAESNSSDVLISLKTNYELQQAKLNNESLKHENALKELSIAAKDKSIYQRGLVILVCFIIAIVITGLLMHKVNQARQLNLLARKDDLTGAPNRRYIIERAQLQFKHAKMMKTDLALAIVDIDFFKNINDSFGHDIGDEVLKYFANQLEIVLRKGDAFGRYGGEEWLLVLPTAKVTDLQGIFNRLSNQLTICDDSIIAKTTFSMGVSQIISTDSTINSVIKRADLALYHAKHHGRNQMVCIDSNKKRSCYVSEP